MMIIGCDFHPSWQQVSWLDTETGETGEQKLVHATGDAKQFYEQLASPVLIGMEATGNSQWFIEWVQELGHEIWIGDAAQIRASYVRKQTSGTRIIFASWWWKGAFPSCGRRTASSATCGSWCCTGTSWSRFAAG